MLFLMCACVGLFKFWKSKLIFGIPLQGSILIMLLLESSYPAPLIRTLDHFMGKFSRVAVDWFLPISYFKLPPMFRLFRRGSSSGDLVSLALVLRLSDLLLGLFLVDLVRLEGSGVDVALVIIRGMSVGIRCSHIMVVG